MEQSKIQENEIHLYISEIKDVEPEQSNLYSLLIDKEREKLHTFKFKNIQSRFMHSKAILRKILENYISTPANEIKISLTEKGKPFINNSNLNFNVSHSKNQLLIAITLNNEIGIDIEYIKKIKDIEKISKRFFSKYENNYLRTLTQYNRLNTFYQIWTRKEAYIKATGDGLFTNLGSFHTKPVDNSKFIIIEDNKTLSHFKGTDLEIIKGYKVACCYKSDSDKDIITTYLKNA